MGGKSAKAPKLPTPGELKPLIELQSQYNRVGYETPFGAQNYRRNPDGTFTMATDIGPEGRALVGRAVGLGMTDSTRQQVPDQLNQLASALSGRVGQRFGMNLGGPMQIAPNPAQAPSKQQTGGAIPQPGGIPPVGQGGLPGQAVPGGDLGPGGGLPGNRPPALAERVFNPITHTQQALKNPLDPLGVFKDKGRSPLDPLGVFGGKGKKKKPPPPANMQPPPALAPGGYRGMAGQEDMPGTWQGPRP